MKKHLQNLLLIAALLVPWSTKAQSPFADYNFTSGMTTFTTLVGNGGTSMSFSSTDDGYATCTLPFAFNFGESTINSGSTIACSANGFIYLGATSASGTTASYTNTSYRIINPMLNVDAHMGHNTGAGAYYKHDASAGTFTIEYHLLGRYSSPYGAYSFQVVLHNNGTIDFIYDSVYLDGGSPTFRVFLNDGPNADRCYVSGTWSNPVFNVGGSSASTMPTSSLPAHGLRYTFAPVIYSCPRPQSLTASNIDTGSFDLAWVDTNAVEWIVSLGSGIAPVTVTTPSYSATGLTPGSTYNVQVTPICAGNDTGAVASLTVNTPCSYLTALPYSYGFEGLSTGSSTATPVIPCWVHINNASQYFGYPYPSSTAHTGSRSLYWYMTTTTTTYADYEYAVLPGIDPLYISLDTVMLRFWAKASSATYRPVFQVGVMTDPYDVSSFTLVNTIEVNPISQSTTDWHEFYTTFEDYAGTGRYIAVRALRPASSWYAYTDDFVLERMPDCPRVTNLHAENLSDNSADIVWSGDPLGSYEIIYYPSSTPSLADTISVTDTVINLYGLTGSTTYTVIITPICTGTTLSNQFTFTTRCAALDSLPYSYGFEGASTGSSTSITWGIPCWYRLNDATQYFGYPYVSSSSTYIHTGSRALYWYNTTSTGTYGNYRAVVLPGIDTDTYPINTLRLKFWAKASSTSYSPVFQVGVMTDPEDMSTFQLVGNVNVDNSTVYKEYIASFIDMPDSLYGQYIAVRSIPTMSWTAYVDDFTIEQAPQCPPIINMEVGTTGTTGAVVSWGYEGGTLGTPQEFEIEYYEVGGSGTPVATTDTLPQIFITGLDTNTTYCVRVRANCMEFDYGTWDSITFTTTGLGCAVPDPNGTDTILFSNGTSTYSGTLVYSGWGNTMYQTIYTAAELTDAGLTAGSISAVDFGFAANSSYAKEFTIFIGTTNMTSFPSSTDYVNPNQLQQVYGPEPHPLNTSGWQHYDFDEPFNWDGSSNIIICTFMNQPTGASHTSSSFSGYYTTGPTNSSLYRYKDSNPFTLDNYTTSSGGSTHANRASIHFYTFECLQQASCGAPMVFATHVESHEAYIEWAAGLNETAWNVEYRVAGASSWTSAVTGTSNMNYTFYNLSPATTYEARVSHYCATDDTVYFGTTTFTTPCAPYQIPFTENFDSYVASSTTQLGPCWNKYYNASTHTTTSYPYPNSSYHHSGSNSLYFYGYNDTYCNWLVLPEMADSIRNLELSFWEYKTSASYGLVEIGVITDPADLTTFTPVDTVQVEATSQWQQFFVNFTNYTGPEGRIAMVGRTGSSYSFYIDDIEVGRYSTCPRIQNLTATNVTNDSAFLSWAGDSSNIGYRVWWGSSDQLVNAVDSLDLTNPNIALGPFGPNATCHVWVSQMCDDGAYSSPVHTSFTTAADCEVISDLFVHNVTSNSAVFTWTEPQAGYPATSYRVTLQSPTGLVLTDTTPNAFYFLSGLSTGTTYTFSVQSFCEHSGLTDSSIWVSRSFTTHDSLCNLISGLGTQTSTSSAPLYTSRAYEYTHMLFFVDELAQMGDTITSLTFNVTTSGSITRNVDVYLGNSDYENLFTPTFPPLATLTQVYSGNWTVQNGQCTINFTTPFVRDHSRNLVVGIDDNTGTAGSSFSFSAAYTTDINTGDYVYTVHYAGGSADVNPATDDAVNVTYVRPIITFGTTCASESCSSPAAIAANPTDTTITVYWNANSGTAWQVEYRLPTDTVWTLAATNVTTPQYTIGGLLPATRYAIRVGSICSATNILYTPIFSATACGDALLPYTDDFDDIVNGWVERPCWRVGNGTGAANNGSTSAPNYPRVVNLTQYGPMMRLYDGAFAVLPHFAEPLHNLQVRFIYHTGFTSDAWCIFGYLTNPNDINSLVVIDTLRHHPTVEGPRLYTIDLDLLSDDADGNLVFYTPHNINYTHIDEIVVDLIPPCAIPDSLNLVYATDTLANLSWYMSNIGSATYMVRYTAYRSGVYDTVFCPSTAVTLTGLIPGTTYDAECYSICLRTGDTSLASNVCRFTTDCAPLPTLPYNQTFENIPLSSTQTLPNCWEIAATNTTDASALPHCVFDNPNAAGGYYYVYVASQSAIAMPEFVAPPDSLQISFYMKTATAGTMVEVGVVDTLVPFSFTVIDTFTTSSTGYEFFSAYLVGYTGPGTRIGIRTLSNTAVYIDNLVIDYAPTCLPVRNLHVDTASANTITLAWRDLTAASQYQIEYGATGFTRGTGTFITVTTNPATILGMEPMHDYDFYVRPICSVGDTAEWSNVLHGTTALCDNLVTVNSWDSSWSNTTSSYAPIVYSLYNYSYTQTIIDAARFADVEAEISAFAFDPAASTQGDYYNHIDIYMANVSENDLSAGFIMPDSNHQFVCVLYDADLRFSTMGWQRHGFDTAFTWDGHSNVLFAVNRRHGAYSSSTSFNAHNTSSIKTRYLYTDSAPYDPATVTGGQTQSYVADLQFFSCAASCDRPDIVSITGDYQSATLTWAGSGNAYEVSYRTALDTNWTTPVPVTGTTYTFTGLMPVTNYELRVRQDCSADSIGYSAWMTTLFVTDSLPCYAPDSLSVSGITNATATFAWTPVGDETAWDLHVWNTAFDTVYTQVTNPVTVGGFTAGVTYNVAVRALCGTAHNIEGDWSDAIQFTAAICADVTGLTTGNVTFNSITVSWDAMPEAIGYRLVCQSGQYIDTVPNVTVTTHTFTNLEPEMPYTISVQTICGADWNSEHWAQVSATTLAMPDDGATLTVNVETATMGYVTINGVETTTYTGVIGDVVSLAAVPYEGYVFVGWDDGQTAATRDYTLAEATNTLTATFAVAEGIAGVESEAIVIYPNPAKGSTTVSVTGLSGKVRISVLDLSGREVLGETVECSADCVKSLDIEGLAGGAYFVRVTSEASDPMVKKLIVR